MSLLKQVKKYTHFLVKGKKVHIPYCIVESLENQRPQHYARTTKDRNFAGKGTPDQLLQVLEAASTQNNFDLEKATAAEIKSFMIEQGIGVDCSGFVYNVLDAFLQTQHKSLDAEILRYPGIAGYIERFLLKKNRVRRSSADTLTNYLNTKKIEKVKDIKAGDLIRLTPLDWQGKHVLMVVKVTPKYLLYAHSSAHTREDGPHVAVIKIIDANAGLEKQEWLEKTKDGRNYGKETLILKNGDGARRFKFLR